jgi:hypothetical protein
LIPSRRRLICIAPGDSQSPQRYAHNLVCASGDNISQKKNFPRQPALIRIANQISKGLK